MKTIMSNFVLLVIRFLLTLYPSSFHSQTPQTTGEIYDNEYALINDIYLYGYFL